MHFKEPIVLIAGGYDNKNLDYKPIAKPILEKVSTLYINGADIWKNIWLCKRRNGKRK